MSTSMSISRKSGLQRQVLALYRRCVAYPRSLPPPFRSPQPAAAAAAASGSITTTTTTHHYTIALPHYRNLTLQSTPSALRIPRTKPPQAQPNFRLLIRYTFRSYALAVSPNQIASVEDLLRRAEKKVEIYEVPSVRHVAVTRTMRKWDNHAGLAWKAWRKFVRGHIITSSVKILN
jgi:hypothetical protein